jgi:hypothetical protein
LFGISRQALYQSQKRKQERMESLAKIKPMVTSKRMKMPKLGTRKLYYLLQDEIKQAGVKIGRDGLFTYLKW